MAELTDERKARLLAYCKLTELQDDPEVEMLIPVLYDAAVVYMDGAGISLPDEGTPRRAQYDLCVNYMVLDAWDRREASLPGSIVTANQTFRSILNQLKLTEGLVSNLDTSE